MRLPAVSCSLASAGRMAAARSLRGCAPGARPSRRERPASSLTVLTGPPSAGTVTPATGAGSPCGCGAWAGAGEAGDESVPAGDAAASRVSAITTATARLAPRRVIAHQYNDDGAALDGNFVDFRIGHARRRRLRPVAGAASAPGGPAAAARAGGGGARAARAPRRAGRGAG